MEKESFEEKMKKLETLVQKLEDKSISLQDSVRTYDEAMKLSKELSEELEKAESKVKLIDENNKETEISE